MTRLDAKLRRALVAVPGARRIKRYLFRPRKTAPAAVPESWPYQRGAPPRVDPVDLSVRYHASAISKVPDTFVLYRIIGNDLPPRHVAGQSRRNLAFILEHEPDLRDCEKRFVVNRIVDPEEEQAVIGLLREAGLQYIHIPFYRNEYRLVEWDIEGVPVDYAPWTRRFAQLNLAHQGHLLMRLYRHKNNYVMNNNGARNVALREGKSVAKWVLPWDGNCFLTTSAWKDIVAGVRAAPEFPFFVVPMARVADNERLLEDNFLPDADEEPQLVFRHDVAVEFDPRFCYGRRPKVELLWRLGVPGKWDSWGLEPWELPVPPYAEEAGGFGTAGWVARLGSGNAHLEERHDSRGMGNADPAFVDRGFARVEAIKRMLDDLDDETSDVAANRQTTCSISLTAPRAGGAILESIRYAADEALLRGPYSVVHKKTLPPSKDRHDYWHPAPYYWPHPSRLPGLPYVRRDGLRVPGTTLYEPLSEKYDRTRLQRLFDDTFTLALAWHFFREDRYAKHAARLVRTWFLVPETAMNPHLEYAQVRWGHNGNRGSNSGIIEMKDLYYFLDAVKLLERDAWLTEGEQHDLHEWFGRYLDWLQTSPQGREERAAKANHGTYYDLQVAAVAAYLGEARLVRETLRDSRSRILQQFDVTGAQPGEMARTNTAHYCCFNLQGWIHLAQLAEAFNEDLWSFQASDGRGIQRAMEWVLRHIGRPWPYPQLDAFDDERFYPIHYARVARYGEPSEKTSVPIPPANCLKPVFHPFYGIMPFWQLASPGVDSAESSVTTA